MNVLKEGIVVMSVGMFISYGPQTPQIQSFVDSNVNDISLEAKIVKGDQSELKKINKDFGASYQFKGSKLSFKVPFKMRAETKIEDSNITYILNGGELTMKFGTFKSKQHLENKPGRRQTPIEIGILTSDIVNELVDAKFVETSNVDHTVAFDLTYKQKDLDLSRNRIWMDPVKKFIVRREWFNQEGQPMATFSFSRPIQVSGVWIPTHMEVQNRDKVVAGVTDYIDIKVNSGLDDSLFDSK